MKMTIIMYKTQSRLQENDTLTLTPSPYPTEAAMPHTLTVSWYGKQADVTFDTPTIDSLMQAAKKVQRFHMRDTDSTRNIVVGREDGDGTIGTRMVNDEDVKDALHIRCTVLMTRKALKRPKHEAQGVNMTDSEQVAKKRMTTIPTAKVLHTRILTEDDDMDARTLFMAGMMLTDQYGAPTSAPDVFSLLHDSAKVVTVTYVECRGKHFEVIKLHKEGASFPSWHCYDTAENCHVWRCVEALVCILESFGEENKIIPSFSSVSAHPLLRI